MSETAAIIAELARVKVLFQARALAAAIGAPQPVNLVTPTPIKKATPDA